MTLSTAVAIGKVGIEVATDKRTWVTIATVIASIITPFVLIIIVLSEMASGMASHNNAVIQLVFNGGSIPSSMPVEYVNHIKEMRNRFEKLDIQIEQINNILEAGSLDDIRIKAIFYALFFDEEKEISDDIYIDFVSCFIKYEEITSEKENITTRVTVIQSLTEVYENIKTKLSVNVTRDDEINASEIYYRIKYGITSTDGMGFDDWIEGSITGGNEIVPSDGSFISPLGTDWRSKVTSEFGNRTDPINGKPSGHTGIDIAVPKGTPIKSAMSGTVLYARYSTTSSYGYHLAIDHGNGLVTLYAHCSELLVTEGQKINQGDVIAKVGATGRVTGNHLHFEVRMNGERQNPRNYLP